MPRSRGSEMSNQRQSPRAPLHLKATACSEANSAHRPVVDRSPKLDERRSPRSPLHEKKKGSKVSDLEKKLEEAQKELKKLSEQLASALEAKQGAERELEETKKLVNVVSPEPEVDVKEKSVGMEERTEEDEVLFVKGGEDSPVEEDSVSSPTTDVFEVAPASDLVEEEVDDPAKVETETKMMIEEQKSEEEEVVSEVEMIRAVLAEKEKRLEIVEAENQSLNRQTEEAKLGSLAATEKADEIAAKLAGAEEELSSIRTTVEKLKEKLESEEAAKASMETEVKRLRVQTEQWRKAAEAAASVLASGDGEAAVAELNGRSLGERCGSMDKKFGGHGFSAGGGGWSPGFAGGEVDDVVSGAKRRGGVGGGIRMFGDIWRKKGQPK
ncbi:Interactor of constitutive active ROPs 4 [Apostasia shenzhenica]|uniref:Interactor of constitutive active ROPs 4 n=1 Tax=Apostasia shenzhenica TaxID=1088818 RepID=A0A2I0APM4_9ASPA|nr:Interactor of constitutive active ROPs 4 [Apostasia shenzhenica]